MFSAKEVCRILQNNGFEKIRQSGSHIIMQKRLGNDTKTVPVPNHSEIAKGTLKSVIHLSGLDVSLFQKQALATSSLATRAVLAVKKVGLRCAHLVPCMYAMCCASQSFFRRYS